MNRKRSILSLLIALLMILSIMIVVACDPPDNTETPADETSETTDTLLITNGTFANATSTTGTAAYLKDTVTGWTKNNGASYYSDAKIGVIDVTPETFNEKRDTITEIEINGPGIAPNTPKDEDGAYTDTNAMLIGIETAGSLYYKNSSAVTIEQGKYYKLEIDVFTQLLENDNDLQGAYIVVNSGIYVVFQAIVESDGWQTYTIYIEANNFENRTFFIELWLGHGPKHIGTQTDADLNPRLTKGYIFFDNVTLTDMTDSEGASEYAAASERLGGEGIYGREAVTSLYYPDESFTYYKAYTYTSYSSSSKYYYGVKPGMHNNYSVIKGGSDITTADKFPTYDSTTSTSGIVDMAKLYKRENTGSDEAPTYEFIDALKSLTSTFRAPDWRDFFDANGTFGLYSDSTDITLKRELSTLKDTTALMIYHPDFAISGAGMKSSQQFLIEKHKYYDISVWAYVWVPKFDTAEPQKESGVTYDEPNRSSYDEGEVGDEAYANALEFWQSTSNQQKITDYNTKVADWLKARSSYAEAIREGAYTAEFRLTGTSVETGSLVKTTAVVPYIYDDDDTNQDYPYVPGGWQQLTFRIRGNELSDRKVNFEFWYGEGEWESDGLMVGGAIFDDISITIGDDPKDNDSSNYDVIAPIDLTASEEFNLINNDGDDGLFGPDKSSYKEYVEEDSTPWQFKFVDTRSSEASATAGLIYGATAANAEDWRTLATDTLDAPDLAQPYGASPIQVTLEGETDPTIFDVLMLYNKDYTATSLEYKPMVQNEDEETVRGYKKVLRNSFYRISMWIRTEYLDSNLGLTISLFDNTDTSLVSLSTLNTNGEWTECAFLIRSSTIEDTEYYLRFELGSGDIFTPSTHVKGVAYITAIIISKINYTEYNSASTDTYTTKKQISNTPSTTDSITNGYFADLSTTNYETSEGDDIIFDENGVLVGTATPNSWTLSSATNAITAPSNLTIVKATDDDEEFGIATGDYYLTWKYIAGGKSGDSTDPKDNLVYLIYIDGASWQDVEDSDAEPTKKDNVLIGRVAQPSSSSAPKFKIEIFNEGTFKVRAAYLPSELPAYDSGLMTGISAYSSTLKNTATSDDGNGTYIDLSSDDISKAQFGVIDYKTYADDSILGLEVGQDRSLFYKKETASSEGLQYLSGYADTLLMLHSDYYTRGGYTASSTSLSSDSYYMLAIWVKTIEGTQASITINNTSKIFTDTGSQESTTDGDYVGFINIDTKGEWVQYRFYMQTLVSSASFQLELFLGNKYAESFVKKEEDGTETGVTVVHGLSKGTVFFDDIAFKTLTKEEYEKYVYGGDPAEIAEDEQLKPYTVYKLSDLDDVYSYFSNEYVFRVLDYTTDSLDLYTAASSTYVSQGGTPKDYTHYIASTATDYDSAGEDELDLAMIYGVYDKRKINTTSDVVQTIMASNTDSTDKKEIWLGDVTEEDIVNFLTSNTGNGNHYLLMGNLILNGQYYLSQTSITLAAASYYKVTFRAKTWFQHDDSYAEFRFEYGNDTTQWSTIRISGHDSNYETDGNIVNPHYEMVEYTFYVYNADPSNSVSGNNISFHLGSNASTTTSSQPDNFFRGLIIIDDITVEKLADSLEYDNAIELTDEEKEAKHIETYEFAASKADDSSDDNGSEETEDADKRIDSSLWLLVSSIVIGGILIAVIVVLVFRRIKKKIDRARPVKVISSIQVNQAPEDQGTIAPGKDEIDDSEFSDDFDIVKNAYVVKKPSKPVESIKSTDKDNSIQKKNKIKKSTKSYKKTKK
ncbi:MAG: hypothetical protein LBF68_05055 [Christensenellaceae bacterium]|nr:hypothetical protein [Christensenellaceae bacterium]